MKIRYIFLQFRKKRPNYYIGYYYKLSIPKLSKQF
jgi:hypothetical protein